MMPGLIFASLSCLFFGYVVLKVSTWRRNFSIGKTSGFPTFYSPAHIADIWWLASYSYLVPWLRALPTSWSEPWASLCQVWNVWKIGYAPYEAVGSDSIMLATPRGNILWTCDAAVVQQIMQQHGNTLTPMDLVEPFRLWGPSIITVEGDEWKKHRRIVTAGFNPTTNAAVWKETLRQSRLLTERWVKDEGSMVKVMKEWTLRFTLNVLSGVLFNWQLDFGEYTQAETQGNGTKRIGFQEALLTVILQLGILFTFPPSILPYMPFATLRKAGLAHKELTAYLGDFHEQATKDLDNIRGKKYTTVLESVVLAAEPGGTKKQERPFEAKEVFGNIFSILLAGHETTGNTLGFILLLLAVYPEYQKQIHAEIDQQLGSRPQGEWAVERDFAALQAGMIGAVQKETLRIYQIVQFIWRRAVAPTTVIDNQGVSHVIPTGTLCCNSWTTVLRHPHVWSEREIAPERKRDLHDSPAMYFDPTRWLRDDAVGKKEVVMDSYFPFGVGDRYCPGKAFATVELTAAMAGIFADYSLELVVSESTLQECNGNKSGAWNRTRDNAIRSLYDDITSMINIELHKELPICLVRRSGR